MRRITVNRPGENRVLRKSADASVRKNTKHKFEIEHAGSICSLVEEELKSEGESGFAAFIEVMYLQSQGDPVGVINSRLQPHDNTEKAFEKYQEIVSRFFEDNKKKMPLA